MLKRTVLRSMESLIYGVDPGTIETGWVIWDGKRPIKFGITPNQEFLDQLRQQAFSMSMYMEAVACYGMPVGKETFTTVIWIGRYLEAWDSHSYPWKLCYRIPIKIHHCGVAKAKDANIAQALRDKYGNKGTKRAPGPFFGVSKHIWSAIAIAAYATETKLQCTSKIE